MVAIPFFLLLISFGSYFILNLNLAVILSHFKNYEKREIEIKAEKIKNEKLREANKDIDGDNDIDSDDSNFDNYTDEGILNYPQDDFPKDMFAEFADEWV